VAADSNLDKEAIEALQGSPPMRHITLARSGSKLTVGAIVVGLFASGVMMFAASYSAFTSTTTNPTNNWSSGTVVLADDDTGLAMFTTGSLGTGQVSGATLKPGQVVVNCIKVTYTGNLNSTVKLYADPAMGNTNGLLSQLNLKIEEGSAGAFGPACTGWSATSTLFNAAMNTFPTTYAGAIASAQASWATNNFRAYKFTITLASAAPDTAQGGTASAVFNWQAQNI
jgi:hypothetical protein